MTRIKDLNGYHETLEELHITEKDFRDITVINDNDDETDCNVNNMHDFINLPLTAIKLYIKLYSHARGMIALLEVNEDEDSLEIIKHTINRYKQ